MDLGLRDATVVVNGGSKGMGRAAAEAFAAEGAKVAVLARGKQALDETVAALLELGAGDAVPLQADITDAQQVAGAFGIIEERWGILNVLVNASGPVDVGVSAHSTRRQSPDIVAYTAAKAALTSLSKNLSVSLAPEGILVNTVSPGSFLSEGMKGYLRSLPPERGVNPDNLWDAMRVIREDFGHPANMGRAGDPQEIGPVIAFVGSQVNSYMTGADINVDGGSDF
jgi:3-oxoacyl-[acyl-carrier protein] reductase